MTTNEIADVILRNLCEKSYPVFLTTFAGVSLYEADVFAINKNGYMTEFEIKRSRADFLNDFKNKPGKHKRLKERTAIHIRDEWVGGKRTGNKGLNHLLNKKAVQVLQFPPGMRVY